MAIESDVLVIGGGLAGLMSALSAAKTGADVRLLSHKESTLKNASGLIDILGYTRDDDRPLVDPFDSIPELPSEHPYQTVGTDGVREAMDFFDEIAPRYRGEHTDANALLPTHTGSIKPTARYPSGMSAGIASDDRDVLLVGFETLPDFDAPHASAHLSAAGVPFETRGVTIQFPGTLQSDATATRYAKLLESNPEVSARDRNQSVRAGLSTKVAKSLENEQRVGFPAILGLNDPTSVRNDLKELLGVDIFEVPMGPPSIPGLRLENNLFSAIDEEGLSIEIGNPVVDYDGENRIEQVLIDRNGLRIPYVAEQYVLATGGLVGKGIDSDRDSVSEPVFDCHVGHPSNRYDWFEREPFGNHAFARFGLRTDDDLRPRDSTGALEFENLHAAGSILGGFDFAAENSGSGVSIATGYAAGERAAEEAS